MNSPADTAVIDAYSLDEQIGFRLRLAMQRHTAIFFAHMDFGLTQTQFAVLARLWETGAASQNELGRSAAIAKAKISNEETLAPLTAAERKTLIHLLGRLSD